MRHKTYFLWALLFIVMIIITGCASSGDGEVSVEKTMVTEVRLPSSPFYSGFSLHAFIQDSSLIRKITSAILKDANIDVTLLSNLIRKIYVNKIDDDFVLFIEARFDSLVSKKNMLKVSDMQAVGTDGRLWSLSNTEHDTLYFDMQYTNVVAVTNIDPALYLQLFFDWKLDTVLQDVVESDSGFWLYGSNLDFMDKFAFDSEYLPEWGFISANGYDAAGYLLTTVAIPYSGLRKDLVTIKILLPAILDNFDVRENTSLPFVSAIEKTMIIKGIHISPTKVDDYMSYITAFSDN